MVKMVCLQSTTEVSTIVHVFVRFWRSTCIRAFIATGCLGTEVWPRYCNQNVQNGFPYPHYTSTT